jgi:hypothetical protein
MSPAVVPVPNVCRFRFLWSDSGDLDVSNTMFFRYSGGPPAATDALALAVDGYTAMAAPSTLWNADTQLTGCEVTDLSGPSGAQATHNAVTNGAEAGSPLAGGTCLVASYQIGRRYRGGKPRNYFPWGSSADLLTRQSWNSSFVTTCQTNLASVIATIIGKSSGSTVITSHANVSYYQGNTASINPRTGRAQNFPIPRAAPLVDTIVGIAIRPQPGSQRRRNRV